MSKNVEITTAQKNRDDFFAPGDDFKIAFDSVDPDWIGMYMVGEHGSEQKYEATQPVDEQTFDYQGPPSGYVFDR
jgi:hypothetical protein